MSDGELMEIKRVPTRIAGLDEKLQGGIPENFNVVICGPVGTLKSSIAFSILYNAAKEDIPGIYFSLEQMTSTLLMQMKTMNMDHSEVANRMTVLDIGLMRRGQKALEDIPLEELDWAQSIVTQIKAYQKMMGIELCVIDSINVLETFTDTNLMRSKYFHLLRELKEIGMTTILISERPDGDDVYPASDVLRYQADGLIALHLERKERHTTRLLQVAKMRMTDHPTDFYPLLYGHGKFKILVN